jgi:hypothetical protein
MNAITFRAIFNKITTTVDGGWRLSIDVDNSEKDKLNELANYRDNLLAVAIVPQSEEDYDA